MNISPHHGAAAPRRRGWGGRLAAAGAALILCTIIAPAAWGERARAAEAPGDAEVLALVRQHCVQCHAAEPTHEAFAKPPAGIMLETIEQVRRYAPRIRMQVVETRAMPLGNQTGMTDEDRERIAAWIEGRKE